MVLQVAHEQFVATSDIDCDCDELADPELEVMIDAASDILAVMSGGLVMGRGTDTVRPRGGCGCTYSDWCACREVAGVTLRGPNPVVTSIKIDGVTLASSDYVIVDDRLLVRAGGQVWPRSQDLTLASTEPNTFEIIYTYGLTPPYLATLAAEEIVCSFIKNPPQSTGRALHPQARAMTIAGVQITLEQLGSQIRKRVLLMPQVSRFLTVYAPDGPVPAFVYAPELEDGWILHTVA